MRLVDGLVRIFALEIVWKLIGKILIIRLGRDFCGDSWILFGGFGVWWAVGVWESRDFLGVYRSWYRSGFWEFWCGVCDEYLGMIWCANCTITM